MSDNPFVLSEGEFNAVDDYKALWEGTACPVCKGEKWANSPFCRDCSANVVKEGWGKEKQDALFIEESETESELVETSEEEGT